MQTWPILTTQELEDLVPRELEIAEQSISYLPEEIRDSTAACIAELKSLEPRAALTSSAMPGFIDGLVDIARHVEVDRSADALAMLYAAHELSRRGRTGTTRPNPCALPCKSHVM